ncbi:MAG: serine--tRNA ligase [Acidimicrobiales bacterium]
MIDIRQARDNPDGLRSALARRGVPAEETERLVAADAAARSAAGKRDDTRAKVKELSRLVAAAKRAGDTARVEQLAGMSRLAGETLKAEESAAANAADEVRALLLMLPNIPADDVPEGTGPDGNVIRETWPEEERVYGQFQRIPHWDIGRELGILDLERGAKLSGSMFPLYRGMGARLLRALTAFALDHHRDMFEEVRPPTLVKTETMMSTGHLPKFADDAYHLERDDLWAIPTAEVPLTSMFRGEILPERDLPVCLTAYTPCFRREAGSAGRDTRGLLRVHEFDKVELFAYTTPDQSEDMFTTMVARARELLVALGLEHRVVALCAGDMGISAARTFDLEVYAPGCDQWLEVSSISWCSDYQARRAGIRYKPDDGGSAKLVHTLNGSALAWARIWAALVETGHREDGSVQLPDALSPYLGGDLVISR